MTPEPVLGPARLAALAALVERVFPGAGEMGAVSYIEGQLASSWGRGEDMYRDGPFWAPQDSGHGWQSPLVPREVYAHGIDALERHARAQYGEPFAALAPASQDAALGALERGEVAVAADMTSDAFFTLVRENVLEGVFGDPRHGGNRDGAGWRWLGYPAPT